MTKRLPVVLCDRDGSTWRFWCPFCRVEHVHGAGAGHRAAHCFASASPFNETGYILKKRPANKHRSAAQ